MKQRLRTTDSSARSVRALFQAALLATVAACLSVASLVVRGVPEPGAGDSNREYIPAINLSVKSGRVEAVPGSYDDEPQPGVGIYFRVAKQFRRGDAEEYMDDGGYDEVYYQDENHYKTTVHLGGVGGGDASEILESITEIKNETMNLHEERSIGGTLLRQSFYDTRVYEDIENGDDELGRIMAQSQFGTRRISAELLDRLVALSVITVTGVITIDNRAATQVEFLEDAKNIAMIVESREAVIDDDTGFVLRDELQATINGETSDNLLIASDFNASASLPAGIFEITPDLGETDTSIVQKPFDLNDGESYPAAAQVGLVRSEQTVSSIGEIKGPIYISGTLSSPRAGLLRGWYIKQILVDDSSGRAVHFVIAPEGGEVPDQDLLNMPTLALNIVAEQADEELLADNTVAMARTFPADKTKSDIGDLVHYLTWVTSTDIRMIVRGNRLIETRRDFLDHVNAWISAPTVVP